MIDESEYKLPRKEPQNEPTEAERQAARDNEEALNDLDFRPFTEEW